MRPQLLKRLLVIVLFLLSEAAAAIAGPATTPSTRPAVTRPATAPATQPLDEKARRRKLQQLTRKSIELLQKKKFEQAESTLAEAIALDPADSVNLYNMACLLALTGRKGPAVDFLERSADAGFIDFIHIAQDTDLDSLHADARFLAFMAKKDQYLRRAAEAAMDALKKRFGDEYLYELDETDKLIFAAATDQPTLDTLKQELIRQAHSQWDQIFEHKPDQYIAVVVPTPHDHGKLMPWFGVEGFYNHSARMLIVKGLGFVTSHEFTHALHAADLDPLGQEHPIWLVEGMAVMFEHAEYEKGPDGKEVLTPKDNARLKALQGAGRQNKLIPLEKLLAIQQPEFVGNRAILCYAEAGSVMHYLYDLKLLRPFYDRFKADYEKDKTARAALEQTVGKPLEEFEKDWKAWMLKRVAPPVEPASDMPNLGVVFGPSNDGMKVQTVIHDGPAARAGFIPGDVIIAVGDVETRDELSFTPAIAAHRPGDTVTFRLRRNHAYLEVRMVLGNRNDPRSGGAPARSPRSGSGGITIQPSSRPAVPVPP